MTRQEIEVMLLCLACQEPVSFRGHLAKLEADLFSAERRVLFEAVCRIPQNSIDVMAVLSNLKGMRPERYGGPDAVGMLFSKHVAVKPGNIPLLIDSLYEMNAMETCREVAMNLLSVREGDNIFAQMESARIDLLPKVMNTERSSDLIFEEMLSPEQQKSGIRTYIGALDEFLKYLEPGDMVVLAGSPSMGKTSVALNIWVRNVLAGVPSGIFSLEMRDTKLMRRVTSMETMIESSLIREGQLTADMAARIARFKSQMKEQRFFINHTDKLASKIVNIMRAKANEGFRLFMVDYLQLMKNPSAQSREQEVAQMSGMLKEVAMETGTVVFALSQLSREHTKRGNPRPQMSDLRESGAIEQDADIIIFPFRPSYFNFGGAQEEEEQMELIIGKGRDTGTATVFSQWNGRYTRVT
jgi:replicative DNA helicase